MTVQSPCVGICQLDDTMQYCIGCYRTRWEIAEWLRASDERRTEIIEQAQKRNPHHGND